MFVFFQAPGSIFLICTMIGLFIGGMFVGVSEVIALLAKSKSDSPKANGVFSL
ncbi:hypothetical protein [Pontibacillus yanchengensis]|uniref:Uncharacterized protein n=1 Tax=Pontibacillus yanchengensis TaxID=462910 RepID=A0A6I5A072_9BACI|nr:hypothetical protein [Pontibacillus yanchengensis]MYL33583.1 hypothetical protein [Pontibacillus yanchengensis]